ncbi:uncharacterized protein At5g39570 [Macadamia integrifolia]|uniref:uncharacterized protein At5g39570 n=1 Tax=Macadamia integrifolia TaxID=60698 RepID=UPI001C4FF05A|nr:uncharacterized protein At5g39570 [Macadamia integrifolia]
MDGYTSQSNFLYSPQPSFFSNSLWEWELNQVSHRSMIYYSVTEFNEPEFEEYDPTPYAGGYDQSLTYGKPLPPSDAICYPLSTPKPTEPISPLPLQEVPSYGSTDPPSGGGEEEVDHSRSPPNRKKSTEEDHPKEEISSHGGYDVPVNGYGNGYGYPLPGWSDCGCVDGYGRQEPQSSWFDCGYDYGYGKQGLEPQAPPDYGFCESLFGYWPCLSKKEREQRRSNQQQQQIGEEHCYGNNQWNETADFLFGSMNPYGERNYQQHSYKQNECNVPIWVQNGNYHQVSPSPNIDGKDAYFYNDSKYQDEWSL